MQLGVMMFPTDLAIRPDDLAREAEQRGFESLWFPEHTHIPVSRRTEWPGGGPLPEEYKRTHDPFVALAFAAAATERLRVGTGICLVAQRDPIVLAKEIASLDVLSGGRLLFGVGYGWNVDEMEHHGVTKPQRRAVVREKLLAMKALWTEDEAAFDGEHVRFTSSWSWPKPVQRPHPPILFGGRGSPRTYRDIVELADGWMPIPGRVDFLGQVDDLRAEAKAAGRDPTTLDITAFGAPAKPAVLEQYAAAGVTRAIFGLPPAAREDVLPVLDRYAALV